jgi:lysophospholipase L1-like esterase
MAWAAVLRRGFVLVTTSVAVFFVVDFAITEALWYRLYPEKALRIPDPLFHHALKPSYRSDRAVWGYLTYLMRTNSLGFKDSDVRIVPKRSDRARVVFIGDSYTEGVGVPFDETFVGQFSKRAVDLDVLNAGVVSYSPSIYWRKVKWLIDEGYAFNQLVVYVDISDVQDEAVFYRETPDGRIVDTGAAIDWAATVGAKDAFSVPNRAGTWLREHLFVSMTSSARLRSLVRSLRDGKPAPGVPEAPRKMLRGWWTIDPDAAGFGEMGVKGGIAKEIAYMDRLKHLADEQRIKLSVAVYPWPDQLDYDRESSRQVKIWHDWCAQRSCAHFVDHFEDFFAYKRNHPDWRERLFIRGDIHFTREGHRIIADRLLRTIAAE